VNCDWNARRLSLGMGLSNFLIEGCGGGGVWIRGS
jgi:hypothetical protein